MIFSSAVDVHISVAWWLRPAIIAIVWSVAHGWNKPLRSLRWLLNHGIHSKVVPHA